MFMPQDGDPCLRPHSLKDQALIPKALHDGKAGCRRPGDFAKVPGRPAGSVGPAAPQSVKV